MKAKIEIRSGQSIFPVLVSDSYGISPKTPDHTPVLRVGVSVSKLQSNFRLLSGMESFTTLYLHLKSKTDK